MNEVEFTLADCEAITAALETFTQADRDRIDALIDEQECYWTPRELMEYENWLARMNGYGYDELDDVV